MAAVSHAKSLYDAGAQRWVRREPISLSDFTGRPAVFSLCGDVTGLDILDLGCGEGYCARILKERGAASIFGIDLSSEMITHARAQELAEPLGISYEQGCVLTHTLEPRSVDLALAVFLFNYMSIADMGMVLARIYDALRPGGRMIFAVPHPAFPFLNKGVPPFHVEVGESDYFTGRDTRMPGAIHRIDGQRLDIEVFHKTFADYMTTLAEAGFTAMPVVRELTATDDVVEKNPAFFGPVRNVPLHLAISVTK